MIKVKISKDLQNKTYFAYLYRCLKGREKVGDIELSIYDKQLFYENYYELIYINEHPVFFDLRDNISCTKNLFKYFDDFTLFKGNYSSEFWYNAEQGIYPKNFEYKLKDFEFKFKDKIRPFALGRAIAPLGYNEINYFKSYQRKIKYDVVSYSGSGIFNLQTNTRLKLFDLIKEIFDKKTKLMFQLRNHYSKDHDYSKYINKYPIDINIKSYCNYISFISSGKYNISTAGLCLSTPFRFVDAILSNRCIISTKIWHDIYNKFSCVKLPICGYLGIGDWDKTKEILNNLDKIDYNTMLKQNKDIYSYYLSDKGMWENQIMGGLK